MSITSGFFLTDPKNGRTYRRSWTLTVIEGPDRSASANHKEATGVLGAANASILPLTDDTVSRFHAELEFSSEGVYVRDLDSTNGTFINEQAINEGLVEDGESFKLGHTEISLTAINEDIEKEIQTLAANTDQLLSFLPAHAIAESKSLKRILATAQIVAQSTANILLIGDKGTGKSELARWIHEMSSRGSSHIFTLTVPNRASISAMNAALFGVGAKSQTQGTEILGPGLLERASGGTLFIEHVERLPPSTRNQLRSALQGQCTHRIGETEKRKVDVRLVSSSSQDNLNAAGLNTNSLRHLASVQMRLPKLEERTDDVFAYAAQVLARGSRPRAWIGPRFQKALAQKSWPQNLDSLRTTLEWLYRHPLDAEPLQQARITDLLELTRGDVSEVADRFQVSSLKLFRYLSKHNIQVDY